MKKPFLSILIIIFLGACNEDDTAPFATVQWKSLGLDGHIVNKVQVIQDRIYAATDKGFYTLERNTNSQHWDTLGFENKPCQSFLIIGEDEIIVSLVNRQDDSQTGLFKTTDGGQTWKDFTNGFGGEGNVEPVWDITVNPDNASTYYAVGNYVVARSTDSGLTWEPIFGEWQGFTSGIDFISVNPNDTESIWIGGQNAIEQGFVSYSKDGGSNWNEWLNLVEAPSVAKEIVFHPTRHEEVYIGFEGGLLKTPDNGEEWETLISSEENRFFFGLGIREANPEVMYAAGWLKRFDEPQPFIVFSSKNGGESWEEHTFEGEDFGGVYDMDLVSENGQDKLYMGLYKGGVYEVAFNQ